MFKRRLSLFLVMAVAVGLFPLQALAATTVEAGNKATTTHKTGKSNGYDYELWSQDYGYGSMTLGSSGGAFSCEWNDVNNILFRTGKKYNETKKHSEIGTFSINYAATFNISKGGVAYLAVYGWSVDPLVEYYIIESRGSYNPGSGGVLKGTAAIDGGTYQIYETTRTQQPSIKGTKTFKQYWSIRTTNRTGGTISVSEHFKAWENLGMPMGKMYEVAFVVEAYGGSALNAAGKANVSKMELTVDESTAAPSYNINYKLNKGTNPENAPQSYTEGVSTTLPKPTRTGYKFEGWYDNKDYSGDKITSTGKKRSGNLTLYAKWSVRTYDIKYKLGSSSAKNSSSNPSAYTYGKSVSLKKPTRSGYAFAGWYTKSSFSSSSKITSISKTNTGNVTLYAKWVKLPAKPTSVKTVANSKSAVTVSWKKVSGADGYEVYRATSKSGTYTKVKNVKSGSTVSYKNTKLASNKTYYYKVRAYKLVDGKKVYSSKYSSVSSVKTAK